jgi:hypothetical protein
VPPSFTVPTRGFQRVLKAQAEKQARKPALVVTMPPEAFADTWQDKPIAPVEIGIRILAERDLQQARSNAARSAWAAHPEDGEAEQRAEAYLDGLMAIAVARAACMPDDVAKPYFGAMAEDTAPLALTSEGVRTLFQAVERVVIGLSPIAPEASDEDIAELARIAPEALAKMSRGRARRIRRLIHHALSELR